MIYPDEANKGTLKNWGFNSYKEYLESDEWRYKSGIMKEIKNFTCENCRKHFEDERGLVVHHLNYFNVGNESQDDLMVLCHKCHEKEHKKNE